MMVKNSLKRSAAWRAVNAAGGCLRALPYAWACRLGAVAGYLMYLVDVRHRRQVYQNLKIAFGPTASRQSLARWTRQFFIHFGMNIAEFLCLPSMTPERVQTLVTVERGDLVDAAVAQGKGLIFLTMHNGNWEILSLRGRLMVGDYNVIYKTQNRDRVFDSLIYEYRMQAHMACGGVTLFERGEGARDLMRALRDRGTVGIVFDQGGKEGTPVHFFGREARFAAGAVRLALATGAPLCLAAIHRQDGTGHHCMTVKKVISCVASGDRDADVARYLQECVASYEEEIRAYPQEYMWMYKIWRFDPGRRVLILDDGRTGHLRQSEAVADQVRRRFAELGYRTTIEVTKVPYHFPIFRFIANLLGLVGWVLPRSVSGMFLSWLVSDEVFNAVFSRPADVIISCGSMTGAVNLLLSREHEAINIGILRQGILPGGFFSALVLPQHDCPAARRGVIVTRGAPNSINAEYLAAQGEGLLTRFSHLRGHHKYRIGILLGGDTKEYSLDEGLVRAVIHQVQEVAREIDAEILITTSRRTSSAVERVVLAACKNDPRCALVIIANKKNVPEAMGGILALSDLVVVSSDSISMVSEAASSGKKTVVFSVQPHEPGRPRNKHHAFVDGLNAEGYVLSSDAQNMAASIYNLVKEKISLKTLDDHERIYQGLREIVR